MINYEKLGIMRQNWQVIKARTIATKYARTPTPVDTGNLKYNAIYSIATSDGFKVVWNDRYAYYIKAVNEGISNTPLSAKQMANKDFVLRGLALSSVAVKQFYNNQMEKMRGNLRDTLPAMLTTNSKTQKKLSFSSEGLNANRMNLKMAESLKYNLANGNTAMDDEMTLVSLDGTTDIVNYKNNTISLNEKN